MDSGGRISQDIMLNVKLSNSPRLTTDRAVGGRCRIALHAAFRFVISLQWIILGMASKYDSHTYEDYNAWHCYDLLPWWKHTSLTLWSRVHEGISARVKISKNTLIQKGWSPLENTRVQEQSVVGQSVILHQSIYLHWHLFKQKIVKMFWFGGVKQALPTIHCYVGDQLINTVQHLEAKYPDISLRTW